MNHLPRKEFKKGFWKIVWVDNFLRIFLGFPRGLLVQTRRLSHHLSNSVVWEPEKFSIIRKKTRPSKHFCKLKVSFSAITEREQSNRKENYEEIVEAQIVIENLIPLYPAEIEEFANRPVVLQHQKLIKNLKRDIQNDFTESQIEEYLDQNKNEKKSKKFFSFDYEISRNRDFIGLPPRNWDLKDFFRKENFIFLSEKISKLKN